MPIVTSLHDRFDKKLNAFLFFSIVWKHSQKNNQQFVWVCVQAYALVGVYMCVCFVRFYEILCFLLKQTIFVYPKLEIKLQFLFLIHHYLCDACVQKGTANVYKKKQRKQKIPVRDVQILWCNSNYAGFWISTHIKLLVTQCSNQIWRLSAMEMVLLNKTPLPSLNKQNQAKRVRVGPDIHPYRPYMTVECWRC